MISVGPSKRRAASAGKIILTEVYAVCFEGQSNVYPVIYYDLYATVRARQHRFFGCIDRTQLGSDFFA